MRVQSFLGVAFALALALPQAQAAHPASAPTSLGAKGHVRLAQGMDPVMRVHRYGRQRRVYIGRTDSLQSALKAIDTEGKPARPGAKPSTTTPAPRDSSRPSPAN